MAYIESNHAGLRELLLNKTAIDAEFDDYLQNRADGDWLTIKGLPRLAEVTRQEWPEAVRKQVSNCIKTVLQATRVRLDFDVLHVSNPFRKTNTGPTVYNVQMDSVHSSKRIRDLFSGFFRHHRPVECPASLKTLSVRNKVTIATRVRISILQQLGANYKEKNPGSSIRVKGYRPRPTLTIIPPRGSSGSGSASRPTTYNFVEAVSTLPASLSDDNLAKIFQILGTHHQGELRSIFVILSDDDRERCMSLVRSGHRGGASVSAGISSAQTTSGTVSGPSSGMDLQSGFLASLRGPPPPPPPLPPSSARSPSK